jgi:uncharacterized RDD family membrane protein YckC
MATAAPTPAGESPTTEFPAVPTEYAGLVTRTIAFVIDVILIDLVAAVGTATGALVVAFFRFPHDVKTILKVIAAGIALLWAIGYFVGFWSARGQTPGNRVMQIRVLTATGGRVKPSRGLLRCVGLVLAALPLFAGYLMIPFDRRCRGLQDRVAGTVVVEAPEASIAQARRARQRAAYEAAGAVTAGSVPPLSDSAAPTDSAEPVDERLERITLTR